MEEFVATEYPAVHDTGDFDPERRELPAALRQDEIIYCKVEIPERVVALDGCALSFSSRGDRHCLNACERAPFGG